MIAVIGGTGQVGRHVVRALLAQGEMVACVSRTPCEEISDKVAWRRVESYAREDVRTALHGCTGAIATLGLPYNGDVWLREWAPLVTEVTILPWESIEKVLTGHSTKLTWIGDPCVHHSFSWVPEIASCLVDVCLNSNFRTHELVNLPVLAFVSGHEVAQILSDTTGRTIKVSAMRDPMVAIASPFMASARQQHEMMYEVDQDFLVSDDLIRSLGWTHDRLTIEECIRTSMENSHTAVRLINHVKP